MTEETYIREKLEIERLRDSFVQLDRIAASEKAIAVLQTVIEHIHEKIASAVGPEDLKELKRELEEEVKTTVISMRQDIERVRAEIGKSNEQWAEKILYGARELNAEAQKHRENEQRKFRQQMLLAVFSAALAVIGSLVVIWFSAGRP